PASLHVLHGAAARRLAGARRPDPPHRLAARVLGDDRAPYAGLLHERRRRRDTAAGRRELSRQLPAAARAEEPIRPDEPVPPEREHRADGVADRGSRASASLPGPCDRCTEKSAALSGTCPSAGARASASAQSIPSFFGRASIDPERRSREALPRENLQLRLWTADGRHGTFWSRWVGLLPLRRRYRESLCTRSGPRSEHFCSAQGLRRFFSARLTHKSTIRYAASRAKPTISLRRPTAGSTR